MSPNGTRTDAQSSSLEELSLFVSIRLKDMDKNKHVKHIKIILFITNIMFTESINYTSLAY
ncbi:MAG: hypothetical protein ACI959_001371 [Limisphaerales bacterium]